ncbi:MAG TPA: stalk domain-containing protein [Fimbriimonas sp.]
MTKTIRRMCVVAGMAVLGAVASALPLDAQIFIDRAINSPTLNVRYNGANAALVELRLNGKSMGTRSVNAAKATGETNFSIDLNSLKDGDNEVEIRLFDRTGKVVGSDKINISTDQSNLGPVYVTTPKVGATVMGPVEIKVGFGREMRNAYISFFVDEQFKSMTNFPPYEYLWDTTTESNGWHEVEAWVVDETSSTFKTRKIRVFVNNPGGRTDRTGVPVNLKAVANPMRAGVTGNVVGVKAAGNATVKAAGTSVKTVAPTVSGAVVANPVKGKVGAASGIKPLPAATLSATGPRNLTPTGVRVAKVPAAPKAGTAKTVIEISAQPVAKIGTPSTPIKASTSLPTAALNATTLLPITKGQTLPNVSTFSVYLNSQVVSFDVNPRVDNGVPMTPFRHLIEKAGGKVDWENLKKSVTANADGRSIFIQIGDQIAKVDDLAVTLELAPYLDRGRTIVPLSFIREALNVSVDYDKATGHVLISKK